MSKLDAFIQEKQQRSEEWKAQKTAERDELNAWSDNAILTATMEPNAYLHYLDVQADNPRYSASNVLLAMEQNPEITYINSLKGWNELGRSVKREETGLKAKAEELQLLQVIREPSAFVECYLYRTNTPASAVILQDKETVAARFISLSRFEELMHTDSIAQPVAFRYGVIREALYRAIGLDGV